MTDSTDQRASAKSPQPPSTNGSDDDLYTLRDVEEHFTELVAGVEDHAIFLLNPHGIVMSWNAGAHRIKGYEPAEIIGHPFTRFYTQDAIDSGWPQEELRRATALGKFQDEGWRVCKGGRKMWANVVITALRTTQGELRGFLKITRDLTERRQAEEVLRQSEERLRLMIESVQDYAIFMLDPEGLVISWNAGAERIKGYKAQEIIGQHFSAFYSSEDLASGKPARELVIAKRDGRVEDEGWRVRKDRSHFWANVVITALYDRRGELRGFAKITRDLTDKQQVQKLQLADKQKNDFLAMLAHELRNPLAPIRNGIELLGMISSTEGEGQETTQMMKRQIVHLVRLVDDLLDVSRIVSGKIHLEKEPIDVSTFVDRAIEEVQPILDGHGHELILSRPARPIVVNGDMVRLAQVVSNLLSNAARYTDKPSRIYLSVDTKGGEVEIRVRDSGVGIAPEELTQIFNLFEQGDSTISRSRGGLGLGLTLVKRIMEMHGGRVMASSDGAQFGSEFLVRLPISAATAAAGTHHPKQAAAQSSAQRILVVDDNVDAVTSVERLLKLWGHQVQVAYNGKDGIDKALSFRPNIVFLDIGMPGMSGYDVAKQLRALPELKGVIITAVTGYGQAEDRRRSRDAGFNYHMTKPPNPTALAALIASPHAYIED